MPIFHVLGFMIANVDFKFSIRQKDCVPMLSCMLLMQDCRMLCVPSECPSHALCLPVQAELALYMCVVAQQMVVHALCMRCVWCTMKALRDIWMHFAWLYATLCRLHALCMLFACLACPVHALLMTLMLWYALHLPCMDACHARCALMTVRIPPMLDVITTPVAETVLC